MVDFLASSQFPARKANGTAPWVRVSIMLIAVLVVFTLAKTFTGSFVPANPTEAVIYQQVLLLIVLGSAIIEDKFTKPADSVVNSVMGMVTLIPIYHRASPTAWWCVFSYCLFVFVAASTCVLVSGAPPFPAWRQRLSSLTYLPAVRLGSARVLFSVLFLFAVFSFLGVQSVQAATLVVFWGIFVVIWPLKLPEFLSLTSRRRAGPIPAGRVLRTESPNLIRVEISPDIRWIQPDVFVCIEPSGKATWVLPLYSQPHEQNLVASGLCLGGPTELIRGLRPGNVYRLLDVTTDEPPSPAEIAGGNVGSTLVGFVVEESEIASVRFEVIDAASCYDGMLVWCRIGDARVFYQVTNGTNREESLETQRHGFQIATAAQLGVYDKEAGFRRHSWLPRMNTPVFAGTTGFEEEICVSRSDEFHYGLIPNSDVPVGGPLSTCLDHHLAVLGVTGSGKTEFAFDVVRHALSNGKKVICIDLTSQYEQRLSDLDPVDLSISNDLADELAGKLHAVEVGTWGAKEERRILSEFSDTLRSDVDVQMAGFLEADNEASSLGVIKLEEVSNTKATLFITECFMTSLLHYARDHNDTCPEVLVVVEEAHTVMPEPSTMGLGDFDSKGLVGKIAQIALQGRKFGVGLLVIAQRTATVSKSVLTQCNTIVSFACFDETSLNFLRNIFGKEHVELIPNLRPLQAVVFGRGVRSERPVVVEIPYDPNKDPVMKTVSGTGESDSGGESESDSTC